VRRHQKLPREIIVDRGSDFRSVYFAALLAHYGITLSLRPSAHSRYGGEVESLFGEFKKVWLSQRPGNLADYKEARSVDGSHAPKNSAILRAGDLLEELNRFCVWRDSKPINIHIESGFDMHSRLLKEFPCLAVDVELNQEFLLSTAVETKKYEVDQQRGIKINELWYFSPAISGLKVIKSKVEVRIDPENPHVIFALVNKNWEPLYSSQINSFSAKKSSRQFEEGLVALEGSNFRRRIREHKDLELVSILDEMNKLVSNDEIPIVHINSVSKSVNKYNFDEMDLSELKVEAW
jgi:putative transposase